MADGSRSVAEALAALRAGEVASPVGDAAGALVAAAQAGFRAATDGRAAAVARGPAELRAALHLSRSGGGRIGKVGRLAEADRALPRDHRRAIDLAAALIGGLGVAVQRYDAPEFARGDTAAAAERLEAVLADAEVVLLGATPANAALAARHGALSMPAAWQPSGPALGLLMVAAPGQLPAALDLAGRLDQALGHSAMPGDRPDEEE